VLERLIEELVASELDVLLERKRAKPQIMYHGTTSAILPKVYQMGMIPNPKKGKWKGENSFKYTTIGSPFTSITRRELLDHKSWHLLLFFT